MDDLQVPLALEELQEMETLTSQAVPGPWRWYGHVATRALSIVSEAPWRPRVLDFARWGFTGSQPRFNARDPSDETRMVEASERVQQDAVGNVTGIAAPDAEFIVKSRSFVPRLLAEVRRCWTVIAAQERELVRLRALIERGRTSTTMERVVPEATATVVQFRRGETR